MVGGGIAGSTLAYLLARAGVGVTLVDAGRRGAASAAGAGIMGAPVSDLGGTGSYRPPVRPEEVARLDVEAAGFHPTLSGWLREDGVPDSGHRTVGTLWVHDSAEEADAFVRRARRLGLGPGVPLTGARLRERHPLLRPDAVAVPTEFGARIDGRRLVAALRAAGERRGVTLLEGEARDAGVPGAVDVVAEGRSRRIRADAVCLATGAWPLEGGTPREHPSVPERGQVLRGDVAAPATGEWPVVVLPGQFYICGFGEHEVLLGTTRDGGVWDTEPSARDTARILAGITPYAHGLDGVAFTPSVGLRPLSRTGAPVAGPSGHPAEWVLNGFGGGGLTIAPYLAARLAGEITAAWAADGRTT